MTAKKNPKKIKNATVSHTGDSYRVPLLAGIGAGAAIVWLGLFSGMQTIQSITAATVDPTAMPWTVKVFFYIPWWGLWIFITGIWLWTFAGEESFVLNEDGIVIVSRVFFIKKKHHFTREELSVVERYYPENETGFFSNVYQVWRGRIAVVTHRRGSYYFGTGLTNALADELVKKSSAFLKR